MTEQELKCDEEPFLALWYDMKNFEFRLNDRDYHVGDILLLNEWDGSDDSYTGRSVTAIVRYMLTDSLYGVPKDFCVMGIDITEKQE